MSVPVEKASRLVLTLAAAPALGEVAYGSYQFAATATALLLLCTELGLSVWTTRALALEREKAPVIVGTVLWIRGMAIPPFLLVVVVVAALVGPGDSRAAIVFLAVTGLANAFIDYAGAIFRGFERLRDEAWLNVVRAVLIAGGGLLALRLRPSLASLCTGLFLGTVVSAVYGASVLHRRYGVFTRQKRTSFDRVLAKGAVKQGLQLWLATLLSLLYFKGDVLFLRVWSGNAEVGAYSAAYKVFEGAAIVPSVVLAAAFPLLVRLHGDRDRQHRWERRLVLLLLGLGGLAGAAMYVGGRPLILRMYGSGYLRAVPSVTFLSMAVPVMFLNLALTHFLVARRLEARNVLFSLLMLLVNVGANLILIPRQGGPGAALATLLTELALTVCCVTVLGPQWFPRTQP
jgi:O-antigen/teichoic acid export membrane protein